jgi:hypothetical protein
VLKAPLKQIPLTFQLPKESVMHTDLLGRPTTEAEKQLAGIYEELKAMAAREDLPPCAERNVKKALACMWQVMNDLDLVYEQLYDRGV